MVYKEVYKFSYSSTLPCPIVCKEIGDRLLSLGLRGEGLGCYLSERGPY
jgi:hypothetical protein